MVIKVCRALAWQSVQLPTQP